MNTCLILFSFSKFVLNSFLVFFIIAFATEVCLTLFRVNNPRIRAFCYMLPIIKLPFDLLFSHLKQSGVFYNFNPFSCSSYFQKFIISFLPDGVKEKLDLTSSFALTDYLASSLPSNWLQACMFVVILLTIWFAAIKLIEGIKCIYYLRSIRSKSKVCSRKIRSLKLNQELYQRGIKIRTSKKIEIPFAASSQMIFFPEKLMNRLTQVEYEAVIAHELEHLRYSDPVLKYICSSLCALFWWIPTNWLMAKLDLAQELASDRSVRNYGLDQHALASAIVKTAGSHQDNHPKIAPAFSYFVSSKKAPFARLEMILNVNDDQLARTVYSNSIGVSATSLIFLSFWMC